MEHEVSSMRAFDSPRPVREHVLMTFRKGPFFAYVKAVIPGALERTKNSVLNGIAYHNKSDRLFVTGKNWDSVYRVAIEPTSQGPEHIASVCNLAA